MLSINNCCGHFIRVGGALDEKVVPLLMKVFYVSRRQNGGLICSDRDLIL